MPFEILVRLAQEDDAWTQRLVDEAMARREVPPEHLIALAKLDDVHYAWAVTRIHALAKDPSTSPEWLAQLARSPDDHVRLEVAKHSQTSRRTLAVRDDEDDWVRDTADDRLSELDDG